MYIATSIHNQSIQQAYLCEFYQDAIIQAQEIAIKILNRDLLESELFSLDNEGELFIAYDDDNHYTVCIALTED